MTRITGNNYTGARHAFAGRRRHAIEPVSRIEVTPTFDIERAPVCAICARPVEQYRNGSATAWRHLEAPV